DCGKPDGSGILHSDDLCGWQDPNGGYVHGDYDCGLLFPNAMGRMPDFDCGKPGAGAYWYESDSRCKAKTPQMWYKDDDCGKVGFYTVMMDDDCPYQLDDITSDGG